MTRRVLFLSPIADIGGAERLLLSFLAVLDRTRYDPVVAAPPDGRFARAVADLKIPFAPIVLSRTLERLSLRGERATVVEILRAFGTTLRSVFVLFNMMRSVRPDIVHTNGTKMHLLGTLAARMTGIPVVWHIHDFLVPGTWERLLALLGRRMKVRVLANSEAVRRSLEPMRLGSRAVCIPNGADLTVFQPKSSSGTIRKEIGVSPETPVVGMVGIFAPWKGQDVFLRAAGIIHAKLPAARFFIVGDEIYRTAGHGSFRAQLERQVAETGLERAVIFAGYRQDIPEVMAALDIVVHASVEPEPFGLVVLEAMACGRPVIATDSGGVPEVLGRDGSCGILVRANDSIAMAGAILELAADQDRRERLGRAGRKRAEQLFDIRSHAQRIQQVYDSILEKRPCVSCT
jgi:glycosyltransferase involved in cell wall biosynthesis